MGYRHTRESIYRCWRLVTTDNTTILSWEFKVCFPSIFVPTVCNALKSNKGLAALFGPQSGTTSSHIQSICDTLEIPHIETRWDYRLIRDDYSVNLYPHPRAIGQVMLN